MSDTTLSARIHLLRYEAEDIVGIELRPVDAPAFAHPVQAGAHIDLHLPNGLVRSYSLHNDPGESHRYVVAVLKDRKSRGGSRCVHDQLRVGQILSIGGPRNNFPLDEGADHSVLVAGGIGITPLLCMALRLKQLGRSFEFIYSARSRRGAALIESVQSLGCPVHWHFDDEQGGPPDLRALLAARPPRGQTHYYACGPAVMLDAFEAHCAALGYTNHHIERFSAVEIAAASDALQSYTVELRRSGKQCEVGPGISLLQALRGTGVEPLTSCEEGICGACETRVLSGIPDHRDSVLSPSERDQNKVMMICVSGCRSERLVLDL